jgi:hypothetical protein
MATSTSLYTLLLQVLTLMRLTFINLINIRNGVSFLHAHFTVMAQRETLRFRFGTEETHNFKVICIRHYWAQYNTYIKFYRLYYFTETFKIKFEVHNYSVLVHICIQNNTVFLWTPLHTRTQMYLAQCRLIHSQRIFRSQQQGSQPHNMTETETFDYKISTFSWCMHDMYIIWKTLESIVGEYKS